MKIIRNLCLWLMLVAVLAMPVLAAKAEVTLKASVATANAGDTFIVEAVLENTKAVALGTVALDYDEKIFELVSGQCLLDNAMFGEVLLQEKAGTFMLMLPRKISGSVFSFIFRVKANAAPGAYQIGAEASLGDASGSNVPVKGAEIKVGNPSVTVPTEPLPPVQIEPPTIEEPTQSEELTKPTEQTQPTQPVQSQEQTETAPPADGAEPTKKADGFWWLLIPVLLGGGIAVFAIRKKKL